MIDPASSFGRVAAQYERGRPSWPTAALELVERELPLLRESTVLDLGAGTGKLTRVLVERFARVIAVEPLATMRALIPDGAAVLAGSAEHIPLPDGWVSCVFCGESFHWFDWPRALPEIARVLEPRGGLVLMWNRPPKGEIASSPWPQAVGEALERITPAHGSRYESFAWRDALDESPFVELGFRVVPNPGEVSREALIARIASWSQVASLPDPERESFLAEIAGDLTEPAYPSRLDTHVYWARLGS